MFEKERNPVGISTDRDSRQRKDDRGEIQGMYIFALRISSDEGKNGGKRNHALLKSLLNLFKSSNVEANSRFPPQREKKNYQNYFKNNLFTNGK